MTTQSIFWRLFWKEYRLQRAFWISMIALVVLVQAIFFALLTPRDKPLFLFWTASGLSAFYFLGCGAILFAGEQEAGTYEFQRALPVGPGRVFAAKMVFAIVSALAMFVGTWLLALGLSGWTFHPLQGFSPLGVLIVFGFFGLEMFLWAVLFSMLSRRVLLAAILGVAAASIGVQMVSAWGGAVFSMYQYFWVTIPLRAVAAAILAVADCWLGIRWFSERRGRHVRSAPPAIGAAAPTRAAPFADRFRAPGRMTILGRLVWQHWRQTRWLTAATLGTIVVPLILILLSWLNQLPPPRSVDDAILGRLVILVSLIGVSLLGLCAFHADQWRRGYRFLANRGVPPKYVWLSRQLVAFGPPLVLLAGLLLAALIVVTLLLPSPLYFNYLHWGRSLEIYERVYAFGYSLLVVVGYVVLGISVGQLASMVLRSGLLAGIFSVLLTSLLAGWCWLMWWWHVSWLWSVLPIPLALLLATRLRTRDWLLERSTLRAWLPPALVLTVPLATLLTAVPLYRVYSVPAVDPGFSLADYDRPMTPEEQTTLDLYRQAPRQYQPWMNSESLTQGGEAKEIAWINSNRDAISLAMKASGRKYSSLVGERLWPGGDYGLADLLIHSAAKLEAEGKLDAAFEQYLGAVRISGQLGSWYPITVDEGVLDQKSADRIEIEVYAHLPSWAARPGQTPQRILAATRRLEQVTSEISIDDGIKMAHVCIRRFLLGDFDAIDRVGDSSFQPVPMLTLLWMHLPWERARALRLLDCVTHDQLDRLRIVERAAWRGEAIRQPPPGPRPYTDPWYREMDVPYALQTQVYVPPICYALTRTQDEMVRGFTTIETSRRATRLLLAIEAWKLQHGSLPKTLDELVGSCLDRLPVDPYSGVSFRYFRGGLPGSFQWGQPTLARFWYWQPGPWARDFSQGTIAAGVPLVWSTGERVHYDRSAREESTAQYEVSSDTEEYRGYGQVLANHRANSIFEVWSSGWPFPIP